jgi:dTDP-4-dehydrorhamnose 3,5-epimerase
MVYCVSGEVTDVVVDLRIGSPTYGQYDMFELSETKSNSLYIPKGMAHGFCVRSNQATMVYKVSTTYSPVLDMGIRWDSVGISWGITDPILSVRDQGFRTFEQFDSPFRYE